MTAKMDINLGKFVVPVCILLFSVILFGCYWSKRISSVVSGPVPVPSLVPGIPLTPPGFEIPYTFGQSNLAGLTRLESQWYGFEIEWSRDLVITNENLTPNHLALYLTPAGEELGPHTTKLVIQVTGETQIRRYQEHIEEDYQETRLVNGQTINISHGLYGSANGPRTPVYWAWSENDQIFYSLIAFDPFNLSGSADLFEVVISSLRTFPALMEKSYPTL